MLRSKLSVAHRDARRRAGRGLRCALAVVCFALAARAMAAQQMTVLFGTHVAGPGKGFSVSSFDPKTGALGKPEFVIEAEAPAYFILADGGRRLYTCNSTGFVSAYAVADGGRSLKLLNKVPSGGGDPSYISLDKTGKVVFVANYDGGNVASWELKSNGKIGDRRSFQQFIGSGVNPQRQQHAYAHSIVVDPTNRFVLIGDLGEDKVFIDRFNAKDGSLTENNPAFVSIAAGQGARHVVFHPNGRWVYLNTEMGSNIVFFHWDGATGTLVQQQLISTLPRGFHGTSNASEMRVSADGRFIYASNRVDVGDGDIAVFAIDAKTGQLTPVQHINSGGHTPRNFDIDPTGEWMVVTNHGSNNAQVFRIDKKAGTLTPVGAPVSVPYPFSPRFVAAAK
ncbi:MAG: lactonase family protein [Acidobacteriaceae bacterium]|jgi:6-phosphogluconolactonase